MRWLPRDESFYDLFREQAENLHQGATELVTLFEDYQDLERRVASIKAIEHKGDIMTHGIVKKLNQTFITPFDREDIHALSSAMDDVLDLIDAVASRAVIYKVKESTEGARELTRLIVGGTDVIRQMVAHLKKHDGVLESVETLTQLEKEGDRIKSRQIAKLFEQRGDPIEVIKWKELYEVLEAATDKCEDVGDVIESVVLKST